VDEPLVIDGHLMTSIGPGTGIELALKLLEVLSSPEFAQELPVRMRVPVPDAAWFRDAQV
jgi:hypothetical protein